LKNNRKVVLVFQVVGVGWYMALSLLAGILGGLWLDNRFGTLPILTIIGLVLGSVLAFYGAYRMVLPLVGPDDDTKDGGT
jgi:F0F1-type ATP synthase assembly protein I